MSRLALAPPAGTSRSRRRAVTVAEAAPVVAVAVCSMYASKLGGAHDQCPCRVGGGGCHAATLYRDIAVAAVMGLQRAGFEIMRSGTPEDGG